MSALLMQINVFVRDCDVNDDGIHVNDDSVSKVDTSKHSKKKKKQQEQ